MPDGNRAKGIARLGIKHDSPRCAAVECGKKLSMNVIGHVWGIGNCFTYPGSRRPPSLSWESEYASV